MILCGKFYTRFMTPRKLKYIYIIYYRETAERRREPVPAVLPDRRELRHVQHRRRLRAGVLRERAGGGAGGGADGGAGGRLVPTGGARRSHQHL